MECQKFNIILRLFFLARFLSVKFKLNLIVPHPDRSNMTNDDMCYSWNACKPNEIPLISQNDIQKHTQTIYTVETIIRTVIYRAIYDETTTTKKKTHKTFIRILLQLSNFSFLNHMECHGIVFELHQYCISNAFIICKLL